MNKVLVAVAAVTTLAATAAMAEDMNFTAADKNANGSVSFEEFSVVMPSASKEQFAVADMDKNGELSPEEFTKVMVAK